MNTCDEFAIESKIFSNCKNSVYIKNMVLLREKKVKLLN